MNKKSTTAVFYCPDCKVVWEGDDYTVTDGVKWGVCADCGQAVQSVSRCYLNLQRAWTRATGPTTVDGKAKASKNAYKTGKYSEEMFAPALFGKFAECKECKYGAECERGELTYCKNNLENALRMFQAYKDGDYKAIKDLVGLNQVKNMQILQMAQAALMQKGILVGTHAGDLVLNPAFKVIPEMTALLGFSAEQNLMTPKSDLGEGEDLPGGRPTNEGSDFLADLARKVGSITLSVQSAKEAREKDSAHKSFSAGKEGKALDVEIMVGENPFEK